MCLFSESSCALCFRKYRETLSLKTCTSLKTRTECVLVPHAVCVWSGGLHVMLCKRIFSLCLVAKT